MAARSAVIPAAAVLAAWLWLAPLARAQVTFSAPASFPAETSPGSIALGDFNRDGDPDVVATPTGFGDHANRVSVLLGGAGGSFGPATTFFAGNIVQSVAVGDFNGDSDPDLAVADLTDEVSVLLGGAGGTFGSATAFPAGDFPVAAAVGDFNGDSDPDLAVANFGSNDVSVLLGGPGGRFGTATAFRAGSRPNSVAVGDFNGDSDPDLAVANWDSDDVSVLLGGPGGSFGPATAFPTGSDPSSVSVGDFNGDSDPDLAVANPPSNTVSVRLGGAGGTFGSATAFGVGDFPQWVAVGDFDADADPDLAVANTGSNDVSVLLGGAGGTFRPATAFAAGDGPVSVAAGYLNPDSKLDLALAADVVAVLINTTPFPPPRRPDTAAPETTITSGPSGRTRDRTLSFGFSSNEAGSMFECRFDTGATVSCYSPYRVTGLSEGPHIFQVRATDAAGNTDPSPASRTFTVVSVADALAADARSAARALRQLGIRRLLRKRGFTISAFDALVPGTLTVSAAAPRRLPGARAAVRSIVIAKVRRPFALAGSYRVRVALTRTGRFFLRRARRITVTLTMRFSHPAGTARRTKKVTLKRSPGSRRKPATLPSGLAP